MGYWNTYEQVGRELGVSVMTVKRRVADGTIPAYRIGGSIRIKGSDLENIGELVEPRVHNEQDEAV